MLCEKCGQNLQDDSQFCVACGTEVVKKEASEATIDVRFCMQCGQKLLEDSVFCPSCGVQAPQGDELIGDERFCIDCGQKLLGDSQFCFSCGAKAADVEEPKVEEKAPAKEPPPKVEPAKKEDIKPEPEPSIPPPLEPIDKPQEEISETKPTQNSQGQRKLVIALGVTIVILLAIVAAFVIITVFGERSGSRNEIRIEGHDPDDVIGGGYFVHRVANGHLNNHRNITVGAAFESYFSNRSWVHFMDGDSNQIVSFTGDMLLNADIIVIEIMFQFTWDESSFEPIGLTSNGIWQEHNFMMELLDHIMTVTTQ